MTVKASLLTEVRFLVCNAVSALIDPLWLSQCHLRPVPASK